MRKLLAMVMCLLSFGIVATSQANYITNGDFESGLTGWTTSNDVNLGTGGTSPLSGQYALLGFDVSSGTASISQSFVIPDGVTQLAVSFSYKFAGSDTSSSSYDTALATLRQYLWGYQIASNDLIDSDSPNWVQGTYYAEVNVADWYGWDANSGNLRFGLSEANSSNTNTTFSIDNVNIYDPDAASPVPEPTTMLLLGFGLVGLAGIRRVKK